MTSAATFSIVQPNLAYLSAVDVISLVYIQPARVVRGQPCIRPMNVENRGGDYRGTEGHVSPNILVGGRKGKCPPNDCPFSKIFRTYM